MNADGWKEVAKGKKLVLEFFEIQRGRCLYCVRHMHLNKGPKDTKATFEHLLPRVRGGHTTRENGGASCHRCNNLKHDNTHEEFLSYIRACGSVEAYAALLDRASQYLEDMARARRIVKTDDEWALERFREYHEEKIGGGGGA